MKSFQPPSPALPPTHSWQKNIQTHEKKLTSASMAFLRAASRSACFARNCSSIFSRSIPSYAPAPAPASPSPAPPAASPSGRGGGGGGGGGFTFGSLRGMTVGRRVSGVLSLASAAAASSMKVDMTSTCIAPSYTCKPQRGVPTFEREMGGGGGGGTEERQR